MKLRKPSILVINWVSSCLSLFLSASTAATYIFTAPNYTTIIFTLEPCALNSEYQHFKLRFIKTSLLCRYHWKRVKGGPKTGWRQGYFTDNSNTLMESKVIIPLPSTKLSECSKAMYQQLGNVIIFAQLDDPFAICPMKQAFQQWHLFPGCNGRQGTNHSKPCRAYHQSIQLHIQTTMYEYK
jgi:hypothetical protein